MGQVCTSSLTSTSQSGPKGMWSSWAEMGTAYGWCCCPQKQSLVLPPNMPPGSPNPLLSTLILRLPDDGPLPKPTCPSSQKNVCCIHNTAHHGSSLAFVPVEQTLCCQHASGQLMSLKIWVQDHSKMCGMWKPTRV